MKISFVIPAYNEEKYIGQCLHFVLAAIENKSYDTEIIVVNNASIDKTKELAASFANVKVIDEPIKGLSRARQAGFSASTGDLIANIDADTKLTTQWIETVVKEFSKNPNLVALSGPFIYYDVPLAVKILMRIFYYIGYVSYLVNRYILRVSSMLQGGNYVVKRSALEQINGYDTRFDFWGEDTDVARRLNAVGEVKFTFDLPMYTSGRRVAKEGYLKMAVRYGFYYFWTVFSKKPFALEDFKLSKIKK